MLSVLLSRVQQRSGSNNSDSNRRGSNNVTNDNIETANVPQQFGKSNNRAS